MTGNELYEEYCNEYPLVMGYRDVSYESWLQRQVLELRENAANENGNDANRALATGLYCVKVQANHDCWIADWDGDPGRTLVKENAKTFERMSDAGNLCKEMRAKYPNRNVWVDVF